MFQQQELIPETRIRSEKRCPRLWNVGVVIIIPMMLLIGWAILCGHFLSVLERDEELKSNNAATEAYFDTQFNLERIRDSVMAKENGDDECCMKTIFTKNSYEDCLEIFLEQSLKAETPVDQNATDLWIFVEECTSSPTHFSDNFNILLDNTLSFNWNTCTSDQYPNDKLPYPNDFQRMQGFAFFQDWLESYWFLVHSYTAKGEDIIQANYLAIPDANGSNRCKVNSGGGALFWFTIMTTIGYGNTAPVTAGGRAMVFTLGFVSILAFTACIGAAGYISLVIADDFFERIKMKRLVDGWTSVLFWLSITWVWILVLACIYYILVGKDRGYSFLDSFWFAYISITTVGFGDFFIPQYGFKHIHMFYLPFETLIGFVLLANFLLKLSKEINTITEKAGITDDESLGALLRLHHEPSLPNDINTDKGMTRNEKDYENMKIGSEAIDGEISNDVRKLSEKVKVMIDKAGMTDDELFDALLRLRREPCVPPRDAQLDDCDEDEVEANLES